MNDCVFCKIIKGEIPSNIVYEDEDFVIFTNINPVVKLHYLAVPKKHYATLAEMQASDAQVLGKMLAKIPTLSELLHLENGYRLVINQKGEEGNDAGQEIMHLHIHILAGEKMKF